MWRLGFGDWLGQRFDETSGSLAVGENLSFFRGFY